MSPEKDGPRNRPGGGDPATMKTPSASYSFTIRLQIANRPGMLGRVASAIGEAGGDIGAVDLVQTTRERTRPDITRKARPRLPPHQIVDRLRPVPGVPFWSPSS